ncbi:MAG: RNA polymerase sigma factor [Victivallales bacterium]|nr:RNA polymerase sigma factor [Victivallales bacterium]
MSGEDSETVRNVLDGDVDRFEHLVERYKQKVFSMVGKRVPPADVPSVSQDVFIRCFRSLKNYSTGKPFENWLSRIALRTCYDYWREKGSDLTARGPDMTEKHEAWLEKARAAVSLDEFDEKTGREEANEVLDSVLGRLAPEDRALVTMLYLDDMSVKDAAETLGWKHSKVKVRAMRARRKMREMLKGE